MSLSFPISLSPDCAAQATLMATQIPAAADLADAPRLIEALAGKFPATDIARLLDAAIVKARALRAAAAAHAPEACP